MRFSIHLLILLLFVPASFPYVPPRVKDYQRSPRHSDPVFKLSTRLAFEGKVLHGFIRKSDIDPLLDLRVGKTYSPADDKYGLELTDKANHKFPVFTCREWVRELSKESYAVTTYDMTMQAYFITACSFLYALKDAKPAKKSFISNPRIGLSNLDLLPIRMLSSDWSEEKKRTTVGKLVSRGELKIDKKTKRDLWFTYGDTYLALSEIGRADFDRDGLEDIFVSYSNYLTSGSFGIFGYLILTRRSHLSFFELKESDIFDKDLALSAMEFDLKSSEVRQMRVTKQEYGEGWPFSLNEGVIGCTKRGSIAVFFTADDTTYALNGWARGRKIDGKAVSLDITEIQVSSQDKSFGAEKKSLDPIVRRGLAMCSQN